MHANLGPGILLSATFSSQRVIVRALKSELPFIRSRDEMQGFKESAAQFIDNGCHCEGLSVHVLRAEVRSCAL